MHSNDIYLEGIGDMTKKWHWGFMGQDPVFGIGAGLRGGRWAGLGLFRSRFFEGGEVRIAILSLLSEGPKHGYQLMKEMKERSGGTYQASAGSVYPTLQQLEDEGLIESEQQNGRRVYHLTPAGHKELDSDPEPAKRIWERAASWEQFAQINVGLITTFFPLGELLTNAFKWAAGHPEREEKLKAIVLRTSRELDELVREE